MRQTRRILATCVPRVRQFRPLTSSDHPQPHPTPHHGSHFSCCPLFKSFLAASSFVPTATASVTGGDCSGTTFITNLYTYDITACSTTDVSSTYTLSEATYTRALSADCCGGTAGACDLDDSTVCETPATYDEDATTDISGCTAGSSGCSDNGYWTCSLLVQALFYENADDDLST